MIPIRALRMRSASAGGGAYSETGTLTSNALTGSTYNCSANEKGVVQITVPGGGVWAKRLAISVNTTNGQTGSIIKPVIFSGASLSTATLVMDGLPLTLPNIAANTAEDLWFNAGHTAQFFAAGTYWIGYHCAANGNNVTIQSAAAAQGTTFFAADTYADGTATPFGSSSSANRAAGFAMPYSLTGP